MMNRPVCIIDDDDDVREVMSFALEFEGIKTLPFESALMAEEYLSQAEPESYPCLIIVDYMMPEMNGMEFITLLKAKYPETLGKIPVALSTARLSEDTEHLPQWILRLEKPVDLQKFLELTRRHYLTPPEMPSSSF